MVHLELGPKHWRATRARVDERELALPLGHISVPAAATAEQQSTAG
jgi:hypothetical protein